MNQIEGDRKRYTRQICIHQSGESMYTQEAPPRRAEEEGKRPQGGLAPLGALLCLVLAEQPGGATLPLL